MFEPHPLLWHYLWLAPSTLLRFLAVIVYRRRLHRDFPVFFLFAAVKSLTVLGSTLAMSAIFPRRFSTGRHTSCAC
jgi:hypothetical protein